MIVIHLAKLAAWFFHFMFPYFTQDLLRGVYCLEESRTNPLINITMQKTNQGACAEQKSLFLIQKLNNLGIFQ